MEIFLNNTQDTFTANVAALTAAVGRSATLSNGVEGICAGKLIPAVNNVYIGNPNVAFINCDNSFDATNKIFNYAIQSSDCVLLYSLTSSACNLTSDYRQYASQTGFVLTTMSTLIANSIVQSLNKTSNVTIAITTVVNASSSLNAAASKASQSSKVAMSALYSVAGFIAVIFLFIIISGAVRLHRHPERYGLPAPGEFGNDEHNQHQQQLLQQAYSQRAKGLARAVLDSIPLVTVRIHHKSEDGDNSNNNNNHNNNNNNTIDDTCDKNNSNKSAKGKIGHCVTDNVSQNSPGAELHLRTACNTIDDFKSARVSESDETRSESIELSTFYSTTTGQPGLLEENSMESPGTKYTEKSVDKGVCPVTSKSSDVSCVRQVSRTSVPNTELTTTPNTEPTTSRSHDSPRYTYTTLTRPLSLHEDQTATYPPDLLASLQPLDIDDDDDNAICPICFEGFENGEVLRILPCKHRFHAKCVDPWLLNSSSHCPMCRVDLSIRQDEAVPEQPPGFNNNIAYNANGGDGVDGTGNNGNNGNSNVNNINNPNGNNPIAIPEGYELDSSVFTRFLDIWNAHLLPKEAKKAALTKFQQEAELRRQLRAQRRLNANVAENEVGQIVAPGPVNGVGSAQSSSSGPRVDNSNNVNNGGVGTSGSSGNGISEKLGRFKRNFPKSFGHLGNSENTNNTTSSDTSAHANPATATASTTTTPNANTNANIHPHVASEEDDYLQNHRRWKKFVASRRLVHELRVRRLNSHTSNSPNPENQRTNGPSSFLQTHHQNLRSVLGSTDESSSQRNGDLSFFQQGGANNTNQSSSSQLPSSLASRSSSASASTSHYTPFTSRHKSLGKLYSNTFSSSTFPSLRLSGQIRRNSIGSHVQTANSGASVNVNANTNTNTNTNSRSNINNNVNNNIGDESSIPIPSTLFNQSLSTNLQNDELYANNLESHHPNHAGFDTDTSTAVDNHPNSTTGSECLYQQPATNLPIPAIPPLPRPRYQDPKMGTADSSSSLNAPAANKNNKNNKG